MKTVYLSDERYDALVNEILAGLRTHRITFEHRGTGSLSGLYDTLHDALLAAGLDPVERPALVDALADMRVSDWTGGFDACDAKVTLGEEGNLWPASIQEDAEEIAQAA